MTSRPAVDSELTAKIRRAAVKVAYWQGERDALICLALDEGASSREVAEAAGLSHTGVLKIWNR